MKKVKKQMTMEDLYEIVEELGFGDKIKITVGILLDFAYLIGKVEGKGGEKYDRQKR
jgi:hypothetical protein